MAAASASASASAGIFAKLNLKATGEIVVLDAPASFAPALEELTAVKILRRLPPRGPVHFALAFVTTQAQLDTASRALAGLAEGDALLWFAYPKRTSKRFPSEIHRDRGWDLIRAAGYDSVRMVAIDEDWSALRFRKLEFIRK